MKNRFLTFSTPLFTILCLLSSVFYILTCAAFGKAIVGQVAVVYLLLTILFFILYLCKKTGLALLCAALLSLLQAGILYCWLIISKVYVSLFGLTFSLHSTWGMLFHILMLALGIYTCFRLKQLQ